ncbi:glycoside hydrolase family 15 protein [Lapillicoccus jejuensis]|uniref:GH15 family glucan-1,4-alpha-glucosidase n=1 Tax=Lapillicoccus jejuensis TaxID=402171 RepID=A0A542E5U9_9MICO|nr:glycoside hydrolase family 15 protein [Lapillicoccus jejuensis]TQJ10715.1 GH15 family glucan-1,4-alpha-glucosidase [Lapillicoccus jejuensis]
MSARPTFPPHTLRQYAFLADGHRGALIGPRGEIAWLCAPAWDSGAVFADLLGGPGVYAVTPRDPFVWGGYYEPGTLVWRSRWTTTSTRIECREALATPADPHRVTLLRRVEAGEHRVVVDVVLDVAPDFGRASPSLGRPERDGAAAWTWRCGALHVRWQGAAHARRTRDGSLRLRLEVPAGGRHDLVLELSDRPPPEPVPAQHLWSATQRWWRDTVPAHQDSAAPRDTRHGYAGLRGLTAPGGGMVAAATVGLPERAAAGRNYDYRYVWLRDQAYAGQAVAVSGPDPLLDEAVAFTTAKVLEHGPLLAPAYRLDGRLPPHEETLDLPGYPGGQVVVGNWVRGQFQLDMCGELMQLYAASGRHDHLGSEDVQAVSVLTDLVEQRWREPDAGVWELVDDWWTHSRLACVAGLRAVAGHVATSDAPRLLTLADGILAETSTRCLNADGSWRQAPDRPGVDAALLMAVVRGALPADDQRSVATLAAVTDQLVQDGYVYRYAADQEPLGQAEGAFLLCGFAMSLAQLAAGDEVEAFRWFERQRAAAGPAGLLSEEFDVRQRQMRANLPQGFVHALLIECGLRLGRTGRGRAAGAP